MTVDKSFGLVRVSPLEGEKDPLVTFVREAELREEKLKVRDTIFKSGEGTNSENFSLFRYGYEVLGTYIVRFTDGNSENTFAYVDILVPADRYSKKDLLNWIMDAFDFFTVDPLDFGTEVEYINRKGYMESIVTMIV